MKKNTSGKKKSGGGASFERRHVRPKQVVMGRAVQAQETRLGQKRSAGQDSRDVSLGFDLRRRSRLSANVLVDHRGQKARAGESLRDEERMLAQWHREKQRQRKYSLGEDEDYALDAYADGLGGYTLTHAGHVLGSQEEDYREIPEGRESDAEEDVMGQDSEDMSNLFGDGASVVERSKARKAERQRERAERLRLAESLDDQWDQVASLVLANKRDKHASSDDGIPTIFTETAEDEEEVSKKKTKTDDSNDVDADEATEEDKQEARQQARRKARQERAEKAAKAIDDDAFDELVLALGTEAKGGRAADRIKRPEELAQERVARLEALEAERLRRQTQTAIGDDEFAEEEDDEDEDDELGLAEMRKMLREQNRTTSSNTELMEEDDKGESGKKMKKKSKEDDDLPFTFGVPTSIEEWNKMSEDWGARECELVVHRILTCNHPSLAPDNGTKLTSFMGMLLDRLIQNSGPLPPRDFDWISKSVIFLARELGGESAALAFAPRLRACYAQSVVNKQLPSDGMLCVLKLTEDVFPISDFRHVIATPLILLLSAILSRLTIALRQHQDISRRMQTVGLFLCTLAIQYAIENERFIPEALAFLDALLHLYGSDARNEEKIFSGNCVPLSLPCVAPAEDDSLEEPVWATRVVTTALRVLSVAAKAWVHMHEDCILMLRPLTLYIEESVAPAFSKDDDEGSTSSNLVKRTICLCRGEVFEQQGSQAQGQQGEKRTFRTVERRNVIPLKEYAPRMVSSKTRIAETEIDPKQAQQERLRKLKRAVTRERKAVAREIKKDTAYTMKVLEDEAAEENEAIRAAAGRIRNMLQDEQHEQKLEIKRKEREKKKLRM